MFDTRLSILDLFLSIRKHSGDRRESSIPDNRDLRYAPTSIEYLFLSLSPWSLWFRKSSILRILNFMKGGTHGF